MYPILPGQFKHLISRYRKVTIPDLNLAITGKTPHHLGVSSRTKGTEVGLEPFSGEWTGMHTKHLIKRTSFGVPAKLWDVFISKSCFSYIQMLHRNVL